MTTDLDAIWRVLEVQPASTGAIRALETSHCTAVGKILAAIDENGARAVLFPTSEEDAFAPDISTKVHLERRHLRWQGGEDTFVTVTCEVDRLKPVFTNLVEDMLESVSGSERPGGILRRVLDEWRDLLAAETMPVLGTHRLVGLIAELVTVREVISLDPVRDITVWTGPDAAVHDLRRGSRALEVKGSLARESLIIEIHGIHQLEPPQAHRQLHLVLYRFEEAPDGVLTVPTLVGEILALEVHRHEFLERLGRAGYDLADEDKYARRRFNLAERHIYAVDNVFPRLIPGSFIGGSVPAGVLLAHYSLDLTGPIPVALPVDEADQVLVAFGQAL